jgi:hypothetical protein
MDEKGLRLNDLEQVFELTVSKHQLLKKIRLENKYLKMCWDMVSVVRTTVCCCPLPFFLSCAVTVINQLMIVLCDVM